MPNESRPLKTLGYDDPELFLTLDLFHVLKTIHKCINVSIENIFSCVDNFPGSFELWMKEVYLFGIQFLGHNGRNGIRFGVSLKLISNVVTMIFPYFCIYFVCCVVPLESLKRIDQRNFRLPCLVVNLKELTRV